MPTTLPARRDVRPTNWPRVLPLLPALGFLLAVLSVLAVAGFSYQANLSRSAAADGVARVQEMTQRLQALMGSLKDAETGQRGFLLTGEEAYAAPYEAARAQIPGHFLALRNLSADNPRRQAAVTTLEQLATVKMDELAETVQLRRAGNAAAAVAVVRTDQGRDVMDRIRAVMTEVDAEQREAFQRQRSVWAEAQSASAAVTWGGTAVLLGLVLTAALVTSRDYRLREKEGWVRAGLAGLSVTLQGDQRLERMADNAVDYLAHYLDAQAGSFHVRRSNGQLALAATWGRDSGRSDASTPAPDAVGGGLLRQAAQDQRLMHVTDVPDGYLPVTSSLGRAAPRELLILPALVDGSVQAVVELAFFRRLDGSERVLLERIAESLAIATRAAKDRERVAELLAETQRQSEELQAQAEELRVSNEELEEQSRALRESQGRLQNQQAELEQTNSQLEEQAQTLEAQRDELAGSRITLQQKADDLERASQYKSEFLANMSHELRTPLNSTLILAKLLADNKTGNLSPEQVKFAQTIASAGRDLLTLINDILDLSKIEAGKVDVELLRVPVQRIVDGLVPAFEPMARQRGLNFVASVALDVPVHMVTDETRLGQILKNLLSNALKFTEHGEVALRVAPLAAGGDMLTFSVHDTGIGISERQRGIIFDAFRQADGSTHRKYGGTGLGLSIARDLARLLGGDISVQSKLGSGSVFTLTVPRESVVRSAAALPPTPAPPAPPQVALPDAEPARPRASAGGLVIAAAPHQLASPRVDDDRERLQGNGRTILVVEDDLTFSEMLRDTVREQGFRCIVTHTAADGLAAAARFVPSAVLLDVRLPDLSGLGVLDHLKRDPRTRHIPVHVVSASDNAQEALQMGAVGFAVKPVEREELLGVLQRLEARFAQGQRRVLVVEDDARQRDSIHQLLAAEGVEIVGVATAAEALAALRQATFDCLVLDLNLPDLSGYELLEQMSQADGAFPPVIVYTGRSLTAEHEQKLRRYSRSIIVKDARSPERLLDEVTLFLHQVEGEMPAERQRMLQSARDRESALEGRRVLVVEDDVRNIFALSAVLEPKGMKVDIARNGREALEVLERSTRPGGNAVDLVLMDIMMPEMDGLTAMREIRKRPAVARLPIIALTAKAMPDDQQRCLAAGASDYIAKPLDVEKLLSLIRVWMPK